MSSSADSNPKVEPFILPETLIREFTARSVITGTILGMLFGASSLFLAIKVGLTVSASIPVAVMSITFFRIWSKLGGRDSTILEHNIAQTAGSAGESLAFGVGVTMPAILILGFDLEVTRVMTVAILGGLLGILMMIPLRRALIVKEHATLKYPEGTACAAVLKAGATADDRAAASPSAKAEFKAAEAMGLGSSPGGVAIFSGFAVGLVYKVANIALQAWKDVPEKIFGKPFAKGSISAEISPELLGVGYIIGPRIGSIMCAGGVLAYLVLIPVIQYFGGQLTTPLEPAKTLISDMSPGQIRGNYLLYIGAGAVAAGGLISLLRSLPTIWHGLVAGMKDVGEARRDAAQGNLVARLRTDRDLSMKFVGIGLVILIAGIVAVPSLHMNIVGALLIVVFGFLFVTVSSRLTGEIGSSSNPISGMTVATLLFTCLIFLIIGWTGKGYYITALSIGAIVCIASSNGGTTSQDLKTGFLMGATPCLQQIAILFGTFASALIMGPILLALNQSATTYIPIAQVAPAGLHTEITPGMMRESIQGVQAKADHREFYVWQKEDPAGGSAKKFLVDEKGDAVWLVDPGINGQYPTRPDGTSVKKFSAPKATLISYIIKGILDRKLPWALVLLGVMISLVLELSFVPSLAFAVGVYLPLSSSSPIFIGGAVRWLVDWNLRRKLKKQGHVLTEEQLVEEGDKSPGVLLASGYIAGGAIAGIVIAFLSGIPAFEPFNDSIGKWAETHNPFVSGPNADLLSLIPFAIMIWFLYMVGREKLLSPKRK